MGRLVRRRMSSSSLRICWRLNKAQGSEPSPPVSETATTISEKTQLAMGAWIIGSSTPKSSRMRLFGHILNALPSVVLTTFQRALFHQDAQFHRFTNEVDSKPQIHRTS